MAEPTERDRERAREWLLGRQHRHFATNVGNWNAYATEQIAQLLVDERERAVSTVVNWLGATTESARFVEPLIALIRQGESP